MLRFSCGLLLQGLHTACRHPEAPLPFVVAGGHGDLCIAGDAPEEVGNRLEPLRIRRVNGLP
jgi:hypothetical protein